MQGITNYSVYKEAASNLLSKIDPYETVRHTRFNVFQDILDYAAPDDLKGKKIIDPRPQDNRAGEDYYQTFTKEFDRDRELAGDPRAILRQLRELHDPLPETHRGASARGRTQIEKPTSGDTRRTT